MSTNAFSLRRIARLYEYNLPWLKKQTIAYLLISLATALILILSHGQLWQMGVYSILSMLLTFLFIWAPVIFIHGGDSRIVERLIPASTPEKFSFYLSYLLIFVSISLFGLPLLAEKLYPTLTSFNDQFASVVYVTRKVPEAFYWSQILCSVAAMFTCMYIVLNARSNRVVKAYLWPVAVMVVFSAFVTIYGAKEAFMIGYEQGLNGEPQMNHDEIVSHVGVALNMHSAYSVTMLVIISLYILLMLILSYRAISRKNL